METTEPRLPLDPQPRILQGGMGVGVSGWRLARAVSVAGQLGVVSGTALDVVLARRLQDGDSSGELRRALGHLPIPGVADRIVDTYHVPGGRAPGQPYRATAMVGMKPTRRTLELVVAASFVEVFLAKDGHDRPVGINFLYKIQAPFLAALYGAMLAGVEVVIVGAGVPRMVPDILDRFSRGDAAQLALEVAGATRHHRLTFDPSSVWPGPVPALSRPLFFPIVSSALLARTMAKKTVGSVDGLIVEARTAGGHNAPPRGLLRLDAQGEPIYGERDAIDLSAVAELGLPFWLAGGQGRPGRIEAAREAGATGIQVGTAFAFCRESGLDRRWKDAVRDRVETGEARVFTDPLASPTGFPFKVVDLPGTASERNVVDSRKRICDLGYLRQAYETIDEAGDRSRPW